MCELIDEMVNHLFFSGKMVSCGYNMYDTILGINIIYYKQTKQHSIS